MNRKLLGALVVFLFLASPLRAQVYQWVDEKGVKHYSNTPPPQGVTEVREYNEVKSQAPPETSGGGETEGRPEVESGGEAEAASPEEPAAESPDLAEPPGEEEEQSTTEVEGVEETDEVEEGGDLEEATEPEIEETIDTEQESPESPITGRTDENELIEQERDRLEIRIAQLNRRLEEAQIARDRGPSSDAEQWDERIEQIQSEIEEENSRSAIRIEQIRSRSGSQP